MNIYPSAKQFREWGKIHNRVPIFSEKNIPNFDSIHLFKKLFDKNKEAFLFESGKGSNDISRYTFIGVPNKHYVKITATYSKINLNIHSKPFIGSVKDGWDALNFEDNIPSYKNLQHFWGGWVGYISYEAGSHFERLPRRKHNDLGLPDAYFMQVDRVIAYDQISSQLKYIIASEPKNDKRDYDQYIDEINKFWIRFNSHYYEISIKKPSLKLNNSTNFNLNKFQSNLSAEDYKDRVSRIKVYIREGDIYQANIAQRFETEFKDDPFELFYKLRMINPAPFSGFLRFANFSIVSSSPERLIRIQNDTLETRPIAGTRPRGDDAQQDASLIKELMLSDKERAEHLMLVDLERNDMGRICQIGTVKVTDLMILEQYSHVSHIVSNIKGKLKTKYTIGDLLKALFPGGTITGCPKIRCMEIIHEVEPSNRGPYSGSFGYIGFGRQLDLNIIIRTIIIKDNKAFFHVGAGIVADSDPNKEYEETLAKAAAMIQVLLVTKGE